MLSRLLLRLLVSLLLFELESFVLGLVVLEVAVLILMAHQNLVTFVTDRRL